MEDIYHKIAALRRDRVRFAVCTVVESKGSSPRKCGAKMLVLADGRLERTIGGGALEFEVQRRAIECIQRGEGDLLDLHLTHDLSMCCGGGVKVFVEVQTYAPRLYLFGCGHVGVPLAKLAATCGFSVVAIDGRKEFATRERFGEGAGAVDVRWEEPMDIVPELIFDDETYVVVVTHDHALDEDIVAYTLKQKGAYLGCIGSERKGAMFKKRLLARGLSADLIEKMRTPMGIEIQALTPEEIAVSVVAELIQVRRGSL